MILQTLNGVKVIPTGRRRDETHTIGEDPERYIYLECQLLPDFQRTEWVRNSNLKKMEIQS